MRYITGFFFLLSVVAIDQKCDENSCPEHATCLSNNYCACVSPYILNCQVEATKLSEQEQQANITQNELSYFTIVPTGNELTYLYVVNICSEDKINNYVMNSSLWLDDGGGELGNYLGSVISTTKNQCLSLTTPPKKFAQLPNGETEMYILTLSIKPRRANQSILDATYQVEIDIKEFQYIFDDSLLVKIAIAIVCASGVVVLISISWCCWRKWRQATLNRIQAAQAKKAFESMKKYMPVQMYKELQLTQQMNCAICLCDFEGNDEVRVLVCSHIFHSECIDRWCLKQAICPICRFQLDESSIEIKLNQIQLKQAQKRQISHIPLQQQVQLSDLTYEGERGTSNLRESMYQKSDNIYL